MKHKHRIIPGHEGGGYVDGNVVELSPKQHAMWHYAEWCRKGSWQDKLAWKALSGQITFDEATLESFREGGRMTSSKIHAEKDELGRSLFGLKKAALLHVERDELGRSIHALNTLCKAHDERDEFGRSLLGLRNAERMHAKKDENGKSLQGIENAKRLHAEKDEHGKSLHAVRTAKLVSSQKWQCLVTGYISSPGPLARYQRARGIDISLRKRLS